MFLQSNNNHDRDIYKKFILFYNIINTLFFNKDIWVYFLLPNFLYFLKKKIKSLNWTCNIQNVLHTFVTKNVFLKKDVFIYNFLKKIITLFKTYLWSIHLKCFNNFFYLKTSAFFNFKSKYKCFDLSNNYFYYMRKQSILYSKFKFFFDNSITPFMNFNKLSNCLFLKKKIALHNILHNLLNDTYFLYSDINTFFNNKTLAINRPIRYFKIFNSIIFSNRNVFFKNIISYNLKDFFYIKDNCLFKKKSSFNKNKFNLLLLNKKIFFLLKTIFFYLIRSDLFFLTIIINCLLTTKRL